MRVFFFAAVVAAVASDDCAEEYGQCGGTGWEGPTCCESPGSGCVAQNEYYSQCIANTARGDPVVDLPLGSIRGFDRNVSNQLVSTFWGIPYGAPPVGELRFHYPEPFTQAWSDVRKAYLKPPVCSQSGRGGVEDCLHLNIYAQRDNLQSRPQDRVPVMFWIYGGAYIEGDGWEKSLYDGANLVTKHDVVVVTHNYRLEVLGFNTYTQGSHGETGTQAMADQRLAMQWTHDNVHLFGGDATALTIFGESAGGFSVLYHLVSPPSWPLFKHAILESTTTSLSWFYQPKDLAEEMHQGWAGALGCAAGDGQLACLQALPEKDFMKQPSGYEGKSPIYHLFPSGPVIDGTQFGLLDMPAALLERGQFAQVPLLVGANKNGGSIFEPLVGQAIPGFPHPEAQNEADASEILHWAWHDDQVARINATYPISEFSSAKKPWQQQIEQLLRDVIFQCSDRRIATAWVAKNLPVYVYTFSFNFGPTLNTVLPLKDFHASELPFVWKNKLDLIDLLPLAGDPHKMSDVMSCQWTAFARNGNPNAPPTSGVAVPGCETVHGHVRNWPDFADGRKYYSLNWDTFHKPQAHALQADNTYPSEFPSDARCDMWDTMTFPWHPFTSDAAGLQVLRKKERQPFPEPVIIA